MYNIIYKIYKVDLIILMFDLVHVYMLQINGKLEQEFVMTFVFL